MKIKSIVNVAFIITAMAIRPCSPLADEIELTTRRSLVLDQTPVDTAVSVSGNYIYILTDEKQILVYGADGSLQGKIEVDASVDSIMSGPKDDILLLTSRKQKAVRIASVNFIKAINISGAPVKGPADAPVTIVVFSDFQCSSCARVADLLDQLHLKYPQETKIAFKHYPIRTHPYAIKAAIASIAAMEQNLFWPYHDFIFSEAKNLSENKLMDVARELGIDMKKFEKDYQNPAMVDRIRQDISDAVSLGVNGTPTVFINGRLAVDWSVEGMETAIRKELEKADKDGATGSGDGKMDAMRPH